MNATEIRRLLEKYYKGESSLEEEMILRNYFEGENVSTEFEAEQAIFGHYNYLGRVPEPSEAFEDKIIAALDSEDAKRFSFSSSSKRIIAFSGIAAGIALLIASWFLFNSRNMPRDTFTDPHIAYNETVKVLFNVSSKLNRGTQQLGKIGKISDVAAKSIATIDKSTSIIDKNLKDLDYFQQVFNIAISPMDYFLNK